MFDQIWPIFGTAEIDNEDTLKVCREITKVTDLNLGFFLADGGIPSVKYSSEILKLSI